MNISFIQSADGLRVLNNWRGASDEALRHDDDNWWD
jgi:hypothetical protein